jgi:hypothetical protein
MIAQDTPSTENCNRVVVPFHPIIPHWCCCDKSIEESIPAGNVKDYYWFFQNPEMILFYRSLRFGKLPVWKIVF